ncbi:MAG: hypothetical protein ACREEL_14185 [Stellaceae bacterium]
MEAIVAALQDLRPNHDTTVRNDLAKHLSDSIYRLLRRNVGRNHPNEGWNIIDRVHFQIFEALARPHTADGRGLRVALFSRVMFRLKDAIATEAKARRVPEEATVRKTKKATTDTKPGEEDGKEVELVEIGEHPDLAAEREPSDGEERMPSKIRQDPALLDGVRDADQKIDVDRFLEENVADDRKRLAFRLFMDRIPYKLGCCRFGGHHLKLTSPVFRTRPG